MVVLTEEVPSSTLYQGIVSVYLEPDASFSAKLLMLDGYVYAAVMCKSCRSNVLLGVTVATRCHNVTLELL
jgi:hypothetical protein